MFVGPPDLALKAIRAAARFVGGAIEMLLDADPSENTWARRGYFGLFWFFVVVAVVAIAASLLA